MLETWSCGGFIKRDDDICVQGVSDFKPKGGLRGWVDPISLKPSGKARRHMVFRRYPARLDIHFDQGVVGGVA